MLVAPCVLVVCLSIWTAPDHPIAGSPDTPITRSADRSPDDPIAGSPDRRSPDQPITRSPDRPPRPLLLLPLYVSFGVLEGLDAHSTLRALRGGAVEANPVMKGIAGQPAALVAVKAAVAGGVIWGAEKLRKKSRKAAIALMVGVNVGVGVVVAHNYRAAR